MKDSTPDETVNFLVKFRVSPPNDFLVTVLFNATKLIAICDFIIALHCAIINYYYFK